MAMTEKKLKAQREYRKKIGNRTTKRYEKTKNGKLMRTYRNMLSRVSGIQWRKFHLYEGKDILARKDFYDWSLSCKNFHLLFDEWKASDYDRRLSPSIDRIDASKGYVLGNMQWITHSENSKKISTRKHHEIVRDTD